MPKFRGLALIAVLGCMSATTGCFTIAKQAFHEAMGAKGEVLLISDPELRGLAKYRSLEFQPASTTAGRICSPELLRAYDRCAKRAATDLKTQYPGGEPGLTIHSELLYFQRKGAMSAAFMLTRVRLHHGDESVLDSLVRAESDAFRAGGEDDLAQASVEAVRKFLVREKRPEHATDAE